MVSEEELQEVWWCFVWHGGYSSCSFFCGQGEFSMSFCWKQCLGVVPLVPQYSDFFV